VGGLSRRRWPGVVSAVSILALAGCRLTTGDTTTSVATTTTTVVTVDPIDSRLRRPGAVGLGDPYNPSAGNGGYNVTHYDLDLDLDVATGALTGAIDRRMGSSPAVRSAGESEKLKRIAGEPRNGL